MEIWQVLIVAGLLFLIVEIFTPMFFFLNFALACFITAIFALFFFDWNIIVPIFVVFSALFLLFLRPLLIKKKNGDKKTGLEDKYIGKTAKVVETITERSGTISIYDERWNAISENGEEIPVGSEVVIIRNESLVFFVKKQDYK